MSAGQADRNEALQGLSDERVQAFGLLLEGYQRMATAVEADLKVDADMTLSELEVLIRLANNPDRPLRPGDLADQCVMSTSGCTRLLDRLEQQRLIERHPHDSDRRGLVIELTNRGVRWLESVLPGHFDSIERHLWSVINDRELQQLGATMRKIRNAHRHEPT